MNPIKCVIGCARNPENIQIRRIAAAPAKKYSILTDVFFSTTSAAFEIAGICSKCVLAFSNCFFIISTAGVWDIILKN